MGKKRKQFLFCVALCGLYYEECLYYEAFHVVFHVPPCLTFWSPRLGRERWSMIYRRFVHFYIYLACVNFSLFLSVRFVAAWDCGTPWTLHLTLCNYKRIQEYVFTFPICTLRTSYHSGSHVISAQFWNPILNIFSFFLNISKSILSHLKVYVLSCLIKYSSMWSSTCIYMHIRVVKTLCPNTATYGACSEIIDNWLYWCFTALRHVLGHFGRGQLT